MKFFILLILIQLCGAESDHFFEPTKCEICSIVVNEWVALAEKKHVRSDSEFADASDEFCKGFNEFKIHKEKQGIERFSREPSKTIETLREMRAKGVKVEIGMPYEMWDQPSTEITVLRQGCERLMELYEEDIEEWFLTRGSKRDLARNLCIRQALKNDDSSCIKTKNVEL